MVPDAPDRVNTLRPTHDTHLCQLDVKMTNNCHGTKSILTQNESDVKPQLIDWLIHYSASSAAKSIVALDRNPGPGYYTLLLRLIPGDLLHACPHRQFHTLKKPFTQSGCTVKLLP